MKAERHKLIPSVYAGIILKEKRFGNPDFVTYSVPTIIRVRSGKHDSSTARSHAIDLDHVINSAIFSSLAKTEPGEENEARKVNPVIVLSTDGGPDENPRFEKMIQFGIMQSKNSDLDALFIVTNAPGRSAYNRVERRMAPLSHQLSDVILEHEHYGSHLDNQGRTIDSDLEKNKFEHA